MAPERSEAGECLGGGERDELLSAEQRPAARAVAPAALLSLLVGGCATVLAASRWGSASRTALRPISSSGDKILSLEGASPSQFTFTTRRGGCANWASSTIRTEMRGTLQGCVEACALEQSCVSANYFTMHFHDAPAGTCLLFKEACEYEERSEMMLVELTPLVVGSESSADYGLIATNTNCENINKILVGGSFGGTVEDCSKACAEAECSGFVFADHGCSGSLDSINTCWLFATDPTSKTGRSQCVRSDKSCSNLYMPSLVTDNRVQECTDTREATFYGQHQEDRLLLSEFFCNVRNGKYLEVGAYDGFTYSNTKYFEDVMGWSGLLIEGQPETAALLKANRGESANVIIDQAVCKEKGKMKFTSKPTPTAGNPDHMSDDFKDRWHQDVDNQVIEVTCSPLSDMLADASVAKLDLFVLDVEGGEFEVIKTMDWSVEVCVWLVEMDGTNPEKDQKVEDILVENNYVRSDSELFWQDDQSESYNGGGQNVAFTAADLQACLAK